MPAIIESVTWSMNHCLEWRQGSAGWCACLLGTLKAQVQFLTHINYVQGYRPVTFWEVESGGSGVLCHPQLCSEFEASLSYMRSCLKFQTEQKQTGFRVQDSPSFLFSREARAPQCVDMYKDLAKHPVAPEGLGLLCLPPS